MTCTGQVYTVPFGVYGPPRAGRGNGNHNSETGICLEPHELPFLVRETAKCHLPPKRPAYLGFEPPTFLGWQKPRWSLPVMMQPEEYSTDVLILKILCFYWPRIGISEKVSRARKPRFSDLIAKIPHSSFVITVETPGRSQQESLLMRNCSR